MINCVNHPEVEVSGACVHCGKMFCSACLIDIKGKNYCKPCLDEAFEENKNKGNQQQPVININNTNSSNNVNTNTNANNMSGGIQISTRSKIVALLLCIFLGYLGIHRFYTGKIGTGIIYFFTFGLFGVGVFIDFIMILTGSFRDNYGHFLKK